MNKRLNRKMKKKKKNNEIDFEVVEMSDPTRPSLMGSFRDVLLKGPFCCSVLCS